MALDVFWSNVLSRVDVAFQPIVDAKTGMCFGYEALLRGHKELGFVSIPELFDRAHEDVMLYAFDLGLREKAIVKFSAIERRGGARLFYNLDNRILEMPDYSPGNTTELLRTHGLDPAAMCFEVSERHEFESYQLASEILRRYGRQSHMIAVDDYGAGFSGLQMLYHCRPDVIKIDRFLIEGVAEDPRKRLFVSHVIRMARDLGVTVVAEGVETLREWRVCADLGCDLVQGYAVAHPTVDVTLLHPRYPLEIRAVS